jgi:hypothetical protein
VRAGLPMQIFLVEVNFYVFNDNINWMGRVVYGGNTIFMLATIDAKLYVCPVINRISGVFSVKEAFYKNIWLPNECL